MVVGLSPKFFWMLHGGKPGGPSKFLLSFHSVIKWINTW